MTSEFEFTNILGKPVSEVSVSIKKFDDRIYKDSFTKIGKTDINGKIKVKLDNDEYIVLAKKGHSSQTIILKRKKKRIILMPFFGKIKFKWDWIQKKEIATRFEKSRKDHKVCHMCREPYQGWTDKFKCKYCRFNHCGKKHRLPEEHECIGNLKNPFKLQRWPKYP